jgi:hypothetical protein
MSIAGRNALRGAVVTLYRGVRFPSVVGGGAQTTRWRALAGRLRFRLELLPQTEEILQQVFGAEAGVQLMAMVSRRAGAIDPEPGDVLAVETGRYGNERFTVVKTMLLERATQVGLASTTETVP